MTQSTGKLDSECTDLSDAPSPQKPFKANFERSWEQWSLFALYAYLPFSGESILVFLEVTTACQRKYDQF